MATRKMGRWERRRKMRGEDIWYGVFEMQTSKYGRVALTKSPIIISSLRCSGLCSVKLSEPKKRGGIRTFPAHASSTLLPCVGPSLSPCSASPSPVSSLSSSPYQGRLRAPCLSAVGSPRDVMHLLRQVRCACTPRQTFSTILKSQ